MNLENSAFCFLTKHFCWLTVWFYCWNNGVWSCHGSCYERAKLSTEKFVAAWPMEMVTHWICIILWRFRCLHKAKVLRCSLAKPGLTRLTCFATSNCDCNIAHAWFAFFRYLSYIMDVATPTNDCLSLVYELLMPVLMKGHTKNILSHQEVKITYGLWFMIFNFCPTLRKCVFLLVFAE